MALLNTNRAPRPPLHHLHPACHRVFETPDHAERRPDDGIFPTPSLLPTQAHNKYLEDDSQRNPCLRVVLYVPKYRDKCPHGFLGIHARVLFSKSPRMGRGEVMSAPKRKSNRLYLLPVEQGVYAVSYIPAVRVKVHHVRLEANVRYASAFTQYLIFRPLTCASGRSNKTTPPRIRDSAQYPTPSATPFGYWSYSRYQWWIK